MDTPWFGPVAHPTEEFECLDCSLVAVLNMHGRCERCDSNAVLPCHMLEKRGHWITINGARFWIPSVPRYLSDEPVVNPSMEYRADARPRKQRKGSPNTARPEKKCA